MKIHEKYMLRCLQLAKNGLGTTYPNPMVGSVVAYRDRILGEGWHRKAGEPHAEVNAINSVTETDLLKEATIYVSLEPCSHYGKTPPCSDLIIARGIKKVVVGIIDPFTEVAGRGIKKLLDAGCEVVVGVLEQECRVLNKRFFTFHQKQRPYIILKWAETADGFIAPETSTRTDKNPVWITTGASRQLVHKWRAEEQAILIGTSTALQDNPSLTTRDWTGPSPVRVVLDKLGRIPKDNSVFDTQATTLLLTEMDLTGNDNLLIVKTDFSKNIPQSVCELLYKQNLQSVIIEGGTKTIQGFIDEGLWDEAQVFKSVKRFNSGVKAPQLKNASVQTESFHTDDQLTLFTKND